MTSRLKHSARSCCAWTSAGARRPTFRTTFRPTRRRASVPSARARRAEGYASARMKELLEARPDHTRGPRMPRRSLLAPALLLAALIPAAARPADPALPKGVARVTSVEGVTEYRLANGLKVLLIPDRSIDTITVNVTYLVGSRQEGYGETGMAHLLEHLMFRGTP